MPTTADAALEAQLEYLRSDDRLRERAERAREMSIEERLSLTYGLCRAAMATLDRLPISVRQRGAVHVDPLGPGADEVLARFGSLASPR